DRFLPEVVIDAIDLILLENLKQLPIKCPRGCQIGPERLFDDDPTPDTILLAGETRTAKVTANRRERRWRRREIEQTISLRRPRPFNALEFPLQGLVGLRIVGVAVHMGHAFQQAIGNRVVERTRRELTQGFYQTAAQCVARQLRAADTNDAKVFGQKAA